MGSGRVLCILLYYLHMSRPLRIEYPGAFYHITSRGNARKKIFRTDKDRNQFLFLLAKILKRHNWRCHTFCLMDNHYHLVIETIDPTLSKGMQNLNGHYTQWFNTEHNSVGHIFQGRFKAFLIEEHSYLLNVARYVVLNPVRAKIVNSPQKYPWSSYRALANLDKSPDWLTTINILEQFSKKKICASHEYQKFINDGLAFPSPLDDARKGGILGSQQFIDEMRNMIDEKITKNEMDVITPQRMVGRPTLKQLFDKTKDVSERNSAIAIALNRLLYSSVEIGNFLKLHSSTIRRIAAQYST